MRCEGLLCSGFSCCKAQALGQASFSSLVHGLSCPIACRILPNQGSNPCPPGLAGGFLTTGPPKKSKGTQIFYNKQDVCLTLALRGNIILTVCCLTTKSCPTLCDPMACSMPGSSVLPVSQSLLRLMSIELVKLSSHLFLCCPFLLLP